MDDELGISLTRRYAAPLERVYAAWSDPAEVVKWWGPAGFTTTRFDAEFRAEGRWRATIVGPDGRPLDQSGVFTSVEPGRRLAFSFRWDEPGAIDTFIVVDFTRDGDDTIVTFSQSPFASPDERDSHAEGWRECLSRSAAYLEGRDD